MIKLITSDAPPKEGHHASDKKLGSKLTEEQIQALSNVLTHLVFRNGVVEDLHSRQFPLNDEAMKILNKDVNDRIYTILCLFQNNPDICTKFAKNIRDVNAPRLNTKVL